MRSMEQAAAIAPRGQSPDRVLLERGLAIAAAGRGMTFIAVPAAVTSAAALVEREDCVAAWASEGLVLVGIGIAREVRGGVLSQTAIVVDGAVIGGAKTQVSALDAARPRWIGGFAFAPGGAERAPWTGFGDAWFALPRWTYTVRDGVAQLVLAVEASEATDAARWCAQLADVQQTIAAGFVAHGQPALAEFAPSDGKDYRRRVAAITDAIARGEVAKVVAARTCEVRFGGNVRLGDLVLALDTRHAETTRVMLRPPGAAALVAATPERLVRKRGMLVECDALAGTIPAGDQAEALLASAKDHHEHDVVIRAIAGALVEAGGDVTIEPTRVRALRHVLHLHAPISATLRGATHVLDLVKRLHPTPAVGGWPMQTAIDWIARHEAARGWYAAPIGWFDLDGDGELVVAIRSAVIAGDRATLYAGAGIVAGSDPDRELAETDAKLRAMLGALGVLG